MLFWDYIRNHFRGHGRTSEMMMIGAPSVGTKVGMNLVSVRQPHTLCGMLRSWSGEQSTGQVNLDAGAAVNTFPHKFGDGAGDGRFYFAASCESILDG